MTTEENLYTHYQVDLEGFPLDWNYTVCDSLDGVRDLLEYLDIHLDDPELKAKVIITGIGMTRAAFEKFKEDGISYYIHKQNS